ncbi:MAG: DUF4256 domain-containing protein [Candidatus Gracilibacteria bacterium]|jgi:hypothetical protein
MEKRDTQPGEHQATSYGCVRGKGALRLMMWRHGPPEPFDPNTVNHLPEWEVAGGQKRRTSFRSKEEKDAYDAQGVLRIAEETRMKAMRYPVVFTDPTTGRLSMRAAPQTTLSLNDISRHLKRIDDPDGDLLCAIAFERKKNDGIIEFTEGQRWLLDVLKHRFDAQIDLHPGVNWGEVEHSLCGNAEAFAALKYMEDTGGEPDILKDEGDDFVLVDTAVSLSKRNNVPYDKAVSGLKNGLEIISGDDYVYLQNLKTVDSQSRSAGCWVSSFPYKNQSSPIARTFARAYQLLALKLKIQVCGKPGDYPFNRDHYVWLADQYGRNPNRPPRYSLRVKKN